MFPNDFDKKLPKKSLIRILNEMDETIKSLKIIYLQFFQFPITPDDLLLFTEPDFGECSSQHFGDIP